MNHVHRKKDARGNPLAYVADVKPGRKVVWEGVEQGITALAVSVASGNKKETRQGDKR